MSKVQISRESGRPPRWCYFGDGVPAVYSRSYPAITRKAREAGHEIDSLGWKHKLLQLHWNLHTLDGYPEWTIEDGAPPFWRLAHVRGPAGSPVESTALCMAWDDVAEVDFYQRDFTEDGIPIVHEGETYWSGWWFQTIGERDRFVAWHRERGS